MESIFTRDVHFKVGNGATLCYDKSYLTKSSRRNTVYYVNDKRAAVFRNNYCLHCAQTYVRRAYRENEKKKTFTVSRNEQSPATNPLAITCNTVLLIWTFFFKMNFMSLRVAPGLRAVCINSNRCNVRGTFPSCIHAKDKIFPRSPAGGRKRNFKCRIRLV